MTRAALAILALGACSSDTYTVVTVSARPAVHDAATLAVTLGNSGTMLTKELPVGSHAFPLTFSIDAPSRSGQLDLTIEADDANGQAVGFGSTTAAVGAAAVAIQLDSADFTVNTDFAMDQYLTFDYDSDGLQVGATSDGTWLVAFRDNCNGSGMCNVFGRKFDAKGVPVRTVAAAGTNAFQLTTTLTTGFSDPAVVTSGTQQLALWNYSDTVGTGTGIGCRTLDAMGDPGAGQVSITADNASVVSAATFSNGNIAVVWQLGLGIPPSAQVRASVIKPDCTPVLSTPTTISQTEGMSSGPTSPDVATNGATSLVSWIVDGDVYIRLGNSAGTFAGNESNLIMHSTTQQARGVRVVASGTGFAVVVRWIHPDQMSPGKIELFQVSSTGVLMGTTLVTDQSRSDYVSGFQSPSVTVRASDGAILVAWNQCDSTGSTGTCDVYGRMVRPTGTTSGEPFILSTTTDRDQTQPAVASIPGPDGAFAAVWTDSSQTAPDTSGTAVRGRIIYPSYDPNGTM